MSASAYMKSTYWWIIDLDPNHPDNTRNRLDGYSMHFGPHEKDDKHEVFQDILKRLYVKDYWSKSLRIMIYKRVGEFVNKNHDALIVVCEPFSYTVTDDFKQEFETTVKDFYNCILHGGDLNKLFPGRKKNGHASPAHLNIDYKHLTIKGDLQRLDAHCKRMIQHGKSFAEVEDFNYRYLAKYGNI